MIQRSLVAPPQLTQLLSIEDLRSVQAVGARHLRRSRPRQLRARARDRDAAPGRVRPARAGPFISFGASPRGPISLIHAARGLAVVRGRDYVLVQDVQELIKDAFRHRLVLSYEALAERRSADDMLDEVIAAVPVPQLDLSGKAA